MLDFAEVAFDSFSPKGVVCLKFFRGRDDRQLVERAKESFQEVKVLKPKSSRSVSSESYLLAKRPKQHGGSQKGKPG